MLYKIDNFEKKTPSDISFDTMTLACGESINIYEIKNVHDLTQFIGFGKYKNNQASNVFLRGQPDLYDGKLIPSLYRGKTDLARITYKYNRRMNKIKEEIASFSQYDRVILEPLLQHYGVKTTYLDLVDNVWVALWFAVHQTKCVSINSHEYVYYSENTNPYSYILLVASDALNVSETNYGVYDGNSTCLIDLRKALPSYFLRPHAQHAYMLKKKGAPVSDYSDLIIGIAKIPTDLGLKWIGDSEFLTVSSLFPAAYFDSGYSILLKKYPEEEQGVINQYGSIQILTD